MTTPSTPPTEPNVGPPTDTVPRPDLWWQAAGYTSDPEVDAEFPDPVDDLMMPPKA